jgi:outer membrane PBP1 activator LpoA protein
MPNQLIFLLIKINMKVAIILVSLFFVSCQTKTETQVQAEKIQQQARAEMNSLPVPPVVDSADIDWGAPESTCHH